MYYRFWNLGRNSSTFIWQELANKNIFHFYEPYVDQVHVDELKTMLGGQTLDLQIKYKNATQGKYLEILLSVRLTVVCGSMIQHKRVL